jgi:hypothetical protein
LSARALEKAARPSGDFHRQKINTNIQINK